ASHWKGFEFLPAAGAEPTRVTVGYPGIISGHIPTETKRVNSKNEKQIPSTTQESLMTTPAHTEVSQLLIKWGQGDQEALGRLMPLVYDELRRLASRNLRRERPDHTLQTTALVHEAYLKLVDQQHANWQNRAQFFAIAAQLMRRILVDYARNQQAAKRG